MFGSQGMLYKICLAGFTMYGAGTAHRLYSEITVPRLYSANTVSELYGFNFAFRLTEKRFNAQFSKVMGHVMPNASNDNRNTNSSMRLHVRTLEQLKPILVGYRRLARLTQADLAEKLGITQQSYAQIEADPSRTSVERLFVVLRLLNVEIVLDARDPSKIPSRPSNKNQLKAPAPVKPPPGKETSW